jgi:uncharacterized Ntn-hydrolase superfamily protein
MKIGSLFLLLALPLSAQERSPLRPVATYSIVAVDHETGQIGAAVQSHWFSVGSVVTWAEPGVGAVATQSFINPAYGPRGLYLMRTGISAPEVLASLLRADPDSQVRQVGMIDAAGNVASHTGSLNIQAAGNTLGEGFSVQANMMEKPTVWPAMAAAFESAEGDLADRMLAALRAAQAEGGDLRGMQSAALVVVSGDPNDPPWSKIFDLRVEDSPQPLDELDRLITVARAYRAATAGDDFMTTGNVDSALAAYSRAAEFLPDSATNGELVYWQGLTMLDMGRVEEAIPLLRRAFQESASWIELTRRLPAVGLLSADADTIEEVIRRAR